MTQSPAIGRQIVLPFSKAVEIAWKSIRLRLGRSLLVTGGIVLALAFLMSRLGNDAMIDSMRAWARNPASPAAARHQLESLMAASGVPTTAAQIAASRIQSRWLLGVAMLVAFVGILNAMLMSVTERFREIGTMKCLGALDSFVIKIFLVESLFQGLAGAILGVVLGLGLSAIALTISYGALAWQNLPARQILIDVLLCLLMGVGLTVAAAVYPAWQAARMQPIEAMRVET
jgi:putative ABC transport system permease protein